MLFVAQAVKGTDCRVTNVLFRVCINAPGHIDFVIIAVVPKTVPRQKMYMTWLIEK